MGSSLGPSTPASSSSAAPVRAAFVVGAPRCGTTFLAKTLAAHPQVCFSKPKETHFFVRVWPELAPGLRARELLRRHFAHRTPAQRLLAEGSPSSLYAPEVAGRMREFDPAARFVIAVRNPVDMLASYHARLLYTLDEDEPDLAAAWALQERRARGDALPRRCRDARLLAYRQVCSLGEQVERFLAAAGAERCHVVVYDDLAGDPRKVYLGLLQFLGLDDDGRTRFRRKNENRSFERAWLQALVMNPPPPLARLLAAWEVRGLGRPRIVRALRRRLKKRNTRRRERAPLPPALRAMLREGFAADVQRLGAAIGRDLSDWR
ncbi:MAG TPA: sulfotransferase [Myxococcota bacterium]|nr:sulfotransferase [Myxococcota bacterium]